MKCILKVFLPWEYFLTKLYIYIKFIIVYLNFCSISYHKKVIYEETKKGIETFPFYFLRVIAKKKTYDLNTFDNIYFILIFVNTFEYFRESYMHIQQETIFTIFVKVKAKIHRLF